MGKTIMIVVLTILVLVALGGVGYGYIKVTELNDKIVSLEEKTEQLSEDVSAIVKFLTGEEKNTSSSIEEEQNETSEEEEQAINDAIREFEEFIELEIQ